MSKIGIMQPYFFPYLGYYSLIKKTDRFILFDIVQFIRHGWIERNRILKPQEGWQYVSVPLEKVTRGSKIQDVLIRQNEDWQGRIIRQLDHYKKRAPYYDETLGLVRESLSIETKNIVRLNKNILEKTCEYIGFLPKIDIYSEMNLNIDQVAHPGDWALNISKSLGVNEYVNPTGGVEIFNPVKFKDLNIKLTFLGSNLPIYSQKRQSFENGLSIIDVMMFNSPQKIKNMLDDVYCL